MTVETTCDFCHTRQPPWNLQDGDIGPCRYCGAPLPRPSVLIPKRTLPGIEETSITSEPFCQPTDTGITATPAPDYPDIREIELLNRPPWNDPWELLGIGIRWLILLFRSRIVLALLFFLSVAGIGFTEALWEYDQRSHWGSHFSPSEYKEEAGIKFLTALSILLAIVRGIKISLTSRLDLEWFIVAMAITFILIGGVIVIGYDAGWKVGPHLPRSCHEPRIFGKTVSIPPGPKQSPAVGAKPGQRTAPANVPE